MRSPTCAGGRCLSDETIRTSKLGYTPTLDLPGRPTGIVLAWWDGAEPTLVKVRQPDGRTPKYYEVSRRRPTVFPSTRGIVAGLPLVVVEGEFDCLLMGQALAGLANVVTLGSASGRPSPDVFNAMLGAFPWYVATDNDAAGDKVAESWPRSCRRVRPPWDFKDWTEAARGGVDLRRWWGQVLAGVGRPTLHSWEEVSRHQWGPAIDDRSPGIVIGEAADLDRILAKSDCNPPLSTLGCSLDPSCPTRDVPPPLRRPIPV